MLISHPYRFIYLKTRKTGGTSVEIYFEPYCVDPKNFAGARHHRAAEVSQWGVVGSRGFADETWFNHMPGSRVRELVGETLWQAYFKFCVVRNPFDKAVSQFWFELAPSLREALRDADFSAVRRVFQSWTVLRRFPTDQWIYTVEDVPIVDRFLRFERLAEDLEGVCGRLGIPWEPKRLGRYKSGFRVRPEPFVAYYDPAAISRIREKYSWELEYFGYSCA